MNDVPKMKRPTPNISGVRDVIFISKARPEDDEFTLWLAPKLEAAGYRVFADVLSIDAGERWRRAVTETLHNRAIKMLLCCCDVSLAKEGVQEEIGIAADLAKELKDPKFTIPLRLGKFRKVFGIGELQYIDFVRGWGEGLTNLLSTLKRQKVPCDPAKATINPNWELYRRRNAVSIRSEPERLTSNWLRVTDIPDAIRYFEPAGMVDRFALAEACRLAPYPAEPLQRGFVSFGTLEEVNRSFEALGRFEVKHQLSVLTFAAEGIKEAGVAGQDASNVVQSMFRQAWNAYCRQRGFLEYRYSNAVGFHASRSLAEIGQRIPWGRQGDRRSSMLRNVAKGHVWQFGVSALPGSWPFPHFKLKSRVLFAPPEGSDAAPPFDDSKKQHRLRRTVCKGWRNKQWHGRFMALLEVLSGESSAITLSLGESASLRLDATPMLFSSPVSTELPNLMQDEDEEQDSSTLGRPEPEDDR